MATKFASVTALCVALVLPGLSTTAGAATAHRVQFAKGTSSAILQGRIKGYETIDYVVGARQGQAANISLATKHTATYFNLLAPGKTDEAFFNGSMNGNQFEGPLPANGDYRVRVYMMRSAARRNEVADYRLEIVLAPGPAATIAAPTVDAKVPGTDFHATGELPCAMTAAPPMKSCPFGVVRQGPGNAMVTVTRPDGAKHVIFFKKGRATDYDRSQADGNKPFSATRRADATNVRIGSERYEVVDAIVNGG